MGIDARILLRVKGPVPSEAQLKLWSWNLAASVGHEKVKFDKETGRCAIHLSNNAEWYEAGQAGKVYSQDGPDIEAEPGEVLLEVDVWSRLYEPGYERGDLLALCAIAEWCEQNIPDCTVWYGGDSSGVEAKPWPARTRLVYRKHLYTEEGRAYNMAAAGPELHKGPPTCKLCVPERGRQQTGFGQSYEAWSCKGCGDRFVSLDGGKTWQTNPKDMFGDKPANASP